MSLEVGIDLGSSEIKVIAGRTKGPLFEVHRALRLPVDPTDPPEAGVLDAVNMLAAELGKAPGARYSVSGKELIIRYTKVPPVPVWRLRLLMDFEVKEMAEQAGNDLACDYNLVHFDGKDDDETVLVSVVKEAFLAARHDAIKGAVGDPKSAMPASAALFNAYLNSGELHDGEHVFLVDIGEQNVEMVLQRDGELLFARNVAAGGAMLTKALAASLGLDTDRARDVKEQFGNVTPKGQAHYASGQEEKVANALIGPVGQLSSMLQSGLAFAKAQTGNPGLRPNRILVSGGTAELKGITDYLSNAFGCPVERFQPESGLDTSKLADDERVVFDEDPGRFAVALGLAVANGKEDAFLLDLVPGPVKAKREFLAGKLFTILAAAVAVLALGVHYMQLSGEEEKLRKESFNAKRQASRAAASRAEYEAVLARLSKVNAQAEALSELTLPAKALASCQDLLQKHRQPGVWIQSLDVGRRTVLADPSDSRSEKFVRVLGTVKGTISTVSQEASEALRQMKSAMMSDEVYAKDGGIDVRIGDLDARRGQSQEAAFDLVIDPFTPPVTASEDVEEDQ